MLRFALRDYFLQITKDVTEYFLQINEKKMLQMQGNDEWLVWLHSILGRISTDFRKLL